MTPNAIAKIALKFLIFRLARANLAVLKLALRPITATFFSTDFNYDYHSAVNVIKISLVIT